MKPWVEKRGLPDTCCCPKAFGQQIDALHCPIHGPENFEPDIAAGAHAEDRRLRIKRENARSLKLNNDGGKQ